MNLLDFLMQFKIWSRDGKNQFASRSERQRWFVAKNIFINGVAASWDTDWDFDIVSCVLFPKGKRITLK